MTVGGRESAHTFVNEDRALPQKARIGKPIVNRYTAHSACMLSRSAP